MLTTELVRYLDQYLRIAEIGDYGPQGLQVEAEKAQVQRIALAVDVSPAIIETAVAWQADMLLVHHGIFWRQVERIAGPHGQRVRLFLKHNLHLYAAHLPLDAHPEVGNNAGLAQMVGLKEVQGWCSIMGTPIGVWGEVTAVPLATIVSQLESQLHTKARVLAHGPETVNRIAILSGDAPDKISEAHALGADTFITGETSHALYWSAADYGLNAIYLGHYASETIGVQLLGRHLQEKFGLETRFFDFPTGM